MNDVPVLTSLPASAVRAWRHPRAVVLLWLVESLGAWMLVSPFASVIDCAYGRHPDGDTVLWRAGSLELADLVTHVEDAGRSLIFSSAGLAVAITVAFGLLALPIAMQWLAFETAAGEAASLGSATAASMRLYPKLSLLQLASWLLQGCCAFAAFATSVWSGWTTLFGEVRGERAGWAVGAALMLPLLLVAVVHDLTRAALVRSMPVMMAVQQGIRAMRHHWVRLLAAWGWRGAIGVVAIALGAYAADVLSLKGTIAFALLVIVHQVVIVLRVALKVSWLARTLREIH